MKSLPQAIELEKAVIGAVLLESRSLYLVRDKLFKEVFYSDAHQMIYRAICDIDDEGGNVDMLTVQQRLGNDLEKVGGVMYMTELLGQVTTASHIENHALILLQKYAQRQMAFKAEEIKKMAFDDTVDVDQTISFANQSIEEITNAMNNGVGVKDFYDIVNQSIDEYYERDRLAKEGKISGIPTPVRDLTKSTNGWQKGDLIILAGRPSMGKTAMALQSIAMAVENGYSPMIFSLEMPSVRLVDRILCGKAGVDMSKFRSGYLSKDDIAKIEDSASDLMTKGITIDDKSNATMDYIRSRAIMKNRENKCDMVIIDYGQLLDTSNAKAQTREQEVSMASRKAKMLAKDLNIPVMFLSQLNRGVELRQDKRPKMADLRESGGLEQDADLVLLMYRGAYYNDMEAGERVGEIIIAKQRNGIIGTVKFTHNESLTRIYDYDIEVPDEPF